MLHGSIGGPSPHMNVELDIKMNRAPNASSVYQAWMIDSKTNTTLALGSFDGVMFTSRTTWAGSMGEGPYDTLAVSIEPANTVSIMPTSVIARAGWSAATPVSASNFTTMAVLPQDESFQRQSVMQRYSLTADQVNSLRMQGWSYDSISLIANASTRCAGKSTDEISNMLLQGQTWDQIASACSTTVATLLTPVPPTVVQAPSMPGTAGAGAMPVVAPLTYYRMTPNGVPVLRQDQWRAYQRRGFSWVDVAIAANISSMNGYDIDNLLRQVRISGTTWSQIVTDLGLDPDKVHDVSGWPWDRTPGAYASAEVRALERNYGSMPGTTGAEMAPSAPAY